MLRLFAFSIALASSSFAQGSAAASSGTPADNLLQVKRIYVERLTGGPQADTLRDLLITSLSSTKLFVLTENPEKADAILRGAADDTAYVDTFDSTEGMGAHQNGGGYSGGKGASSTARSVSGGYAGISISTNESHHIKERKHEAYASVRLCNRDGDVLWSTTQESDGAKFRGASADVAMKVARQLQLDLDRQRAARGVPITAPVQTVQPSAR